MGSSANNINMNRQVVLPISKMAQVIYKNLGISDTNGDNLIQENEPGYIKAADRGYYSYDGQRLEADDNQLCQKEIVDHYYSYLRYTLDIKQVEKIEEEIENLDEFDIFADPQEQVKQKINSYLKEKYNIELAKYLKSRKSFAEKMKMLQEIYQEAFAVRYSVFNPLFTLQETINGKKGKCYSTSLLLYAIAEELKLKANFGYIYDVAKNTDHQFIILYDKKNNKHPFDPHGILNMFPDKFIHELNPLQIRSLYIDNYLLNNKENLSEARELALSTERASLGDTIFFPVYNHALILENRKEYRAAIDLQLRVLYLNNNDYGANYHLGKMYKRTSELEKSRYYIQRAIQLNTQKAK